MIQQYNYKGFKISVYDSPEGFYAIIQLGSSLQSTKLCNDIESVKLVAENMIDGI